MASAAKFAVSEYYIAQGKLPASTAEAGMASVTTDYMQSITYQKTDSAGEIVLTLSEDIGGTANSKKVILRVTVEDNFLKWKCKPDDTDGPDGEISSGKLSLVNMSGLHTRKTAFYWRGIGADKKYTKGICYAKSNDDLRKQLLKNIFCYAIPEKNCLGIICLPNRSVLY